MAPQIGALDVAALGELPAFTPGSAPSWDLPDAQFLQINWEVEPAPALQLTPPSLHPSIPPYVSFFAGHYPESPVGAFSLVQARLVVRAGIRPRGLCLGAVCDSPEASAALREHWGYPTQLGEVAYAQRHDQVRFTASLDGRVVADLAVHTIDVINGSDLMTFDNLNMVRIDDRAALVQIDPEYTIHQADRGRPTVVAAGSAGARHGRQRAPDVGDHRVHVPRRHRPRARALHHRRSRAGGQQRQARRLRSSRGLSPSGLG